LCHFDTAKLNFRRILDEIDGCGDFKIMPNEPAYDLADFITCCGNNPEMVYMIDNALADAQNIFHLYTQPEVLEFIANNGLEKIIFLNSKPWERNPDPTVKIFVDAYEFMTGGILGYIAFFKNKMGNWVIKSFHQSNERSGIMEEALRKAKEKGVIK
jgi:hypothetical protein